MQEILDIGLKLIATAGITEVVKLSANSFIKPKLEKLYKNTEKEKNISEINEKIYKYIEKACNNCLYMNTIVFKNQQKKIYDLYIPLTVLKNDRFNNKKESICINTYADNFIPLYKKVLLVDTAGMGKSTIMKYLYLSSIEESKGVPILIELRELQKDMEIIDFVMKEMNGIREHFSKDDILDLIDGGDFIFFFDGYDEITPEIKQNVTNNLQKFIASAGNNMFIIASREENELASFGDFQRFEIQSLSKNEAYFLIKKYDSDGELSKELIEKLDREDNLKILSEFLENPLMVSLLYKAFEYKRKIPYKKHIFYRQVYDALFEEHNLSKGGAFNHIKRSKLDLEDFHRILRSIGFMTLTKGITYSKEQLIEVIKKAKLKNSDIEFKENDFIYDITHSVPLFVKDGVQYRWSHKSFQEYFAASYISIDSKEKQEQLLMALVNEDKIIKYFNVLDFCYEMNYKQFSRIIIYPLINELEKYCNSHYCDKYYGNFNREDLLLRKILSFIYEDISVKKISWKELEENNPTKEEPMKLFKYVFGDNMIGKILVNNQLGISYNANRRIETIITLLHNKQSTIIKRRKINKQDFMKKLIDNINVGEYILNDETNNEINNMDLFGDITLLILDVISNRRRGIMEAFDYDNCIKLKNSIEKDIENEESDLDFL